MRFDGKVALITGGTSGIGEATVRRVAQIGAKTLFVGRNEESGRRIERELVRNGAEAVFFKADLGRPEEVRRIVPATVNIFGRLDFAFNNAGISGENGFIADQREANFDDVFAVNVKGLYFALQDEIQQLVRQGWGGSIVKKLQPERRSQAASGKQLQCGLPPRTDRERAGNDLAEPRLCRLGRSPR